MASKEGKAYKSRAMFMKLFRYIVGVNEDTEEIDMTRPVTTKWSEEGKEVASAEMCFWAGPEWQKKDLPKPLDESIYVQNRPEMIVYVR